MNRAPELAAPGLPRRHAAFLRPASRYVISTAAKASGVRLVFDIETDALQETAARIHCIVVADLDNDRIDEFGSDQIDAGLARLSEASLLVGHNIVGFDLAVLHRLRGWVPAPTVTVVDTLIASRLVLANIGHLDDQAAAMGDPKLGKLRGRHSLEAWGARFGTPKIGTDIEVWTTWSPELQKRCVGDVRLTKALWEFLKPGGQPAEALALEHRVAAICDDITTAGIPFDREAAEQLQEQWTAQRNALEVRIRQQFPQLKNLNARHQIAKLLEERGWVPEERTEKTGQPKIDDETLEDIVQQYPEFDGLAEHYILGRRLAQLATGDKAWLRHIGPDQRIHGGLIHIGTPHHRAKHLDPNLAQVPNPKKGKPLATECRALFRTGNDWVFVTCDQAGLQDRAFAHYLAAFDGGAYARAFVGELDTHWASVQALGLVPAGTARDKESKFHTALREGAKSFRYGFLFGAQAKRAGCIIRDTIRNAMAVDPSRGSDLLRRFFGGNAHPNKQALVRVGGEAKARFEAATPGLRQLRESLQRQANQHGWLAGLDGRRIPVHALYTVLNYAVTSAEAVICKHWLVAVYDELSERFRYGRDGDVVIVAWTHDEIACCCRPGIAEQVGEILVRHAKQAGGYFKFKCPLDAGFTIGASWAGEVTNKAEAVIEPRDGLGLSVAATAESAPTGDAIEQKAMASAPEAAAQPSLPPSDLPSKAPPPIARQGVNGVAYAHFDSEISLKDVVNEPMVSGKVRCPFHDDTRPSCHIYDDHYHCFSCGAHGDAISWLMAVEGLSFRAAQDALACWEPRERRAAAREDDGKTLVRAQVLWDEAEPIAGTPAIDYLAFRKIDVDLLTGGPEAVLRFHPNCPFDGNARVPCLLALYQDIDTDAFAGIHRIALTPSAFTHVPGSVERRMLGRWAPRRRAVKLWPAGRWLVLGEGLETTLAAATRVAHRGHPLRPAWAMLSAGAIASCGPIAGVECVVLLADNEPVGRQAARTTAQRLSTNGCKAVVLTPKAVKDFNDLVRARVGA